MTLGFVLPPAAFALFSFQQSVVKTQTVCSAVWINVNKIDSDSIMEESGSRSSNEEEDEAVEIVAGYGAGCWLMKNL